MDTIFKIVEKTDVKKTAMYVGAALLLVLLYFVVRKKIKEYKEDKKDEKYLNLIEETIVTSDLSYSEAEYHTMANALEEYFGDTGLSGGMLGVNQKGVYDVMKRLKNNSDLEKLSVVFGVRKFKDISFWSPMFAFAAKEKNYNLASAMAQLLTNGERHKVNDILKENGITIQY